MVRKWGTAVLLFLAVPTLALAQNTGKLAGVVTDASTGDPLPGANVLLEGTQLGTITDADGNYVILGLPVGAYNIQASFVGYQAATVQNVEINAGYTRELNFALAPGLELEEIVVEYERPLIQNDAIGAPKIVTAEEIQNLAVRGVTQVAALQGGVVSNDGSEDLFIRGGREQQVTYYVDGVKIIGSLDQLGIPPLAIQEQEMLIGSIPARYGDAMSGVISLSTRTGGPNFFGSFEASTSEMLDDFGHNSFMGTVGGPIVPRVASFFLSARTGFQADATPFAIDIPQLSDGDLDALYANPQVLQIQRADGSLDYVPLPTDLQPGTLDQLHQQLGLAEGDVIGNNLQPLNAPDVISLDRFDQVRGKDQRNRLYDVAGNITVNPSQAIAVRLGGSYANREQASYNYARQLYARDRFFDDKDQTLRGYVNFTQRISPTVFYQVQAEYSNNSGTYSPNYWSDDVRDALFYGDIHHPNNATLASYRSLQVSGDEEDPTYSYVRRGTIQDGTINPGFVGPSTFSLPGVGLNEYEKHRNQQFRVFANGSAQVGVHQIEFGGEYERQTRRYFNLTTAGFRLGPSSLARYYADQNVEAGGAGVERYEDLPYEAFRSSAVWYGYDFRGLNEVDDEDIAAFTANSGGGGPDEAYNIAPHQPTYYGGYISDKIEYRDLVLNLGVRVDVFDNNTWVLRDPYALAPIVRAGELDTSLPPNVGSDYAVYFAGENVVGYRDLDGNFFDANGQSSNLGSVVTQGGGRPRQSGSAFSPEIFEKYSPQVTFMPRIGVSFPVTNQALFFASYNVTSQRPSEFAFAPFNTYEALTSQNRVQNPALKPEKTTQYELGFRQALGSRAAVQISGFYRKQTDLIQVRDVPATFPSGLQTFRNIDFAVTKGAEFEFDLRRTNNLSLNANYTLSFAEGTGSDAQSLGVIAWRSSMGGFSPNFISPMAFDRRHSINLVVDYRLGEGEGPMIFGGRALSNFGVNLVANVGSGMPYTRLDDRQVFRIVESFTDNVAGGINETRMPWTSLINLRIDRRFQLTQGAALTAFLWVQNLLDVRNVLGVYRVSGSPDTDLFLATREGQRLVSGAGSALGDPNAADVYAFHYSAYADAPVMFANNNHNAGDQRYGQPRRTSLGVRLNF